MFLYHGLIFPYAFNGYRFMSDRVCSLCHSNRRWSPSSAKMGDVADVVGDAEVPSVTLVRGSRCAHIVVIKAVISVTIYHDASISPPRWITICGIVRFRTIFSAQDRIHLDLGIRFILKTLILVPKMRLWFRELVGNISNASKSSCVGLEADDGQFDKSSLNTNRLDLS